MRRFILGWKVLGYARHLPTEIVNYADDLCVLGKAPAADMLAAVERLVTGLKLAVNERKPDACGARVRVPRIPRNYRLHGEGTSIATRPSKTSDRSLCRRISEMTSQRCIRLPPEARVERLNRVMTGWANDFSLGQVSTVRRGKALSPQWVRVPAGGSLPRYSGGSASALPISRPARRSLALRPA